MNELVELRSVSKYFYASGGLFSKGERFAAAQDIDFAVKSGETLGIVGESGSGKTTVARIICSVYSADSGSVLFKGQDIKSLKGADYKNYRRSVQMIFQDPNNSLNPKLTIRSSLKDGIKEHITKNKGEIEDRMAAVMDMVGLPRDYLKRYPHEFSGGQRQRISIARAVSVEPELIIADEPVSSLDVSVQAQILNLMKSLQNKGVTFILISHSLAVVSNICKNVVVMRKGRIIEKGDAAAVFSEPSSDYTKELLRASSYADMKI